MTLHPGSHYGQLGSLRKNRGFSEFIKAQKRLSKFLTFHLNQEYDVYLEIKNARTIYTLSL